MQPGWCQPVRQEFMENECEALPGVANPGVWDNRSTVNTKTGYDMNIHALCCGLYTILGLAVNVLKDEHFQMCSFRIPSAIFSEIFCVNKPHSN